METPNPHDESNRDPGTEEEQDICVFHGQPELVSFPSTSEIFHAVFENSFYASCIGNGEGKTLEANETACKIFGYTPEEMTSLTTQDLFDTKAKNYIDYLSLRDSKGRAKSTITGIKKNGERFACSINSLIYFDDNGEKRTLNTLQEISKYYPKNFFE